MRSKREPSSWTPGSGHICSAHFTDDSYEGFGANLAGFSIFNLYFVLLIDNCGHNFMDNLLLMYV